MAWSASREHLGRFVKRPGYFTCRARAGQEVYGECHEVMIGSQMNITLCNVNFSVRGQHGIQSCVIMSVSVASCLVASSI